MDADNSMLVSDDSDSSEDGGYLQALRQLKRLRVQSTLLVNPEAQRPSGTVIE
jgi:hypothetical protein